MRVFKLSCSIQKENFKNTSMAFYICVRVNVLKGNIFSSKSYACILEYGYSYGILELSFLVSIGFFKEIEARLRVEVLSKKQCQSAYLTNSGDKL